MLSGIPKKIGTFTTIWRSILPNCDAWNQWKRNLNQSTTSTWISLINSLVTLLLIVTLANQTGKYCIVKTTLTIEILAPLKTKLAWKSTRQKAVPLRCLVSLSVPLHQNEHKYLLERLKPNALHLQMLQSTFLTTESCHTLVCKL